MIGMVVIPVVQIYYALMICMEEDSAKSGHLLPPCGIFPKIMTR